MTLESAAKCTCSVSCRPSLPVRLDLLSAPWDLVEKFLGPSRALRVCNGSSALSSMCSGRSKLLTAVQVCSRIPRRKHSIILFYGSVTTCWVCARPDESGLKINTSAPFPCLFPPETFINIAASRCFWYHPCTTRKFSTLLKSGSGSTSSKSIPQLRFRTLSINTQTQHLIGLVDASISNC